MNNSTTANKVFLGLNDYQLIGLIFIGLYILGIALPDVFWTSHFLAFFSPVVQFIFIGLSLLLLFLPSNKIPPINISSWSGIGIITIVYGIIMGKLPILHDYYGDSFKFVEFLDQVPKGIPPAAKEALFSFKLGTSDGQDTILSLITYLAHYGEMTYRESFSVFGVVFGMLYVLVWQLFIKDVLTQKTSRLVGLLAGLIAPFLLIFFGHQEIYAPIFFFDLLWMVILVRFINKKSTPALIALVIVWIVCLKIHPIAVMYLPSLALAIILFIPSLREKATQLINWKNTLIWIITPAILVGSIAYFFILEDYNDPRNMREMVMGIDRLFLPLVSPEAPLDTYNLFGVQHIFDILVLPLMWSPAALFLLTYLIVGKRKSIRWNDNKIILIGLILLLNLMLFFAVNPLLSMPIDWDLFSIPAIPLLVFSMLILSQVENSASSLVLPSVSMSLMVIPFFAIHSFTEPTAQRYEALSMRIYDSYFEWTHKYLTYGLEIRGEDYQQTFERREQFIKKLRPHANLGNDYEFTQILIDQGCSLNRDFHQPERALPYFEEASNYKQNDPLLVLYRMESRFALQQFDKAVDDALILVSLSYPDEEKAHSITIHCAIKARNFDLAKEYTGKYLQKWQSPDIIEVHQHLLNGTQLDKLHLYFEGGG